VSDVEARAMIDELKSSPLLNGFRGAPHADKAALARLIAQIARLADDLKDDISEIEINPVIVHPEGEGVTVIDALVAGQSSPQ
jgi:acetyltransferase